MAQVEVRPGVRGKSTATASRAAAHEAAAIPDKLYFRIGEAADLCGLPTYVLRFWESEFAQLKPAKGGTGQRLYRQRDVRMVLRIKQLLYEGGLTIPGARQMLQTEQRGREPQLTLAIAGVEREGRTRAEEIALRQLRGEMVELLEMVGGVAPVAGNKVRPIRPARSRTSQVKTSPDTTSQDLFE